MIGRWTFVRIILLFQKYFYFKVLFLTDRGAGLFLFAILVLSINEKFSDMAAFHEYREWSFNIIHQRWIFYDPMLSHRNNQIFNFAPCFWAPLLLLSHFPSRVPHWWSRIAYLQRWCAKPVVTNCLPIALVCPTGGHGSLTYSAGVPHRWTRSINLFNLFKTTFHLLCPLHILCPLHLLYVRYI